MTHRTRTVMLLPALAGVGAILGWGIAGLPAFGEFDGRFSYLLKILAVPQRHTTNVVSAVVWDYRGIDTLGEEFILFAAVAGIVLLLREQTEQAQVRDVVTSETLRVLGLLAVAPVVLVGLWLVSFGTATPGGGFQGGVVVAGGIALAYLAWSRASWERLTSETWLDPFESSGVGGYTIVGLVGLATAATFLHNLLGHGKQGSVYGGGSIILLNWATAVEVAGASLLLFSEYVAAYVVPLAQERE